MKHAMGYHFRYTPALCKQAMLAPLKRLFRKPYFVVYAVMKIIITSPAPRKDPLRQRHQVIPVIIAAVIRLWYEPVGFTRLHIPMCSMPSSIQVPMVMSVLKPCFI